MSSSKNTVYRRLKEHAEDTGQKRFLITEVFPRITNHYNDLQELELLGYLALEDESTVGGQYMSILK